MMTRRALAGLFLVSAVVASACSSSTPASSVPAISSAEAGGMIQTSGGGQVTVVAEWAGPSGGAEFDIKLDTHAVDLDSLDLSNAVLRNDRGETLAAKPWSAPEGGHHREGTLTFGGDASAFLAGAGWIELVLTGVGDLPERILRWELGA